MSSHRLSTSPALAGRSQGGFTLLEVMLAMTLIAMIMALAYGGFQAATRSTASGEALIEETNQLRITHQFVRRQLSLAQALIIEERENEGVQVRFEGERDWVRFVAPMPGYLSFGGSYVQQLSLERGRDGLELVFYYAMLNGYEPGEIEQSEGVVLMSGLRSGEFRFLAMDPEDQSVSWSDLWEEPASMPLAVSLAIDLDRVNGLVWPELFAPVMLDVSSTATGQPRRLRQIRRASDMLGPGR